MVVEGGGMEVLTEGGWGGVGEGRALGSSGGGRLGDGEEGGLGGGGWIPI